MRLSETGVWGRLTCVHQTSAAGRTSTLNDHAHYKCPKQVVFDELPKTATGKVQKFVLRDRAKAS